MVTLIGREPKISWSLDISFLRYPRQTDRQTQRHGHRNISHPAGGEVNTLVRTCAHSTLLLGAAHNASV